MSRRSSSARGSASRTPWSCRGASATRQARTSRARCRRASPPRGGHVAARWSARRGADAAGVAAVGLRGRLGLGRSRCRCRRVLRVGGRRGLLGLRVRLLALAVAARAVALAGAGLARRRRASCRRRRTSAGPVSPLSPYGASSPFRFAARCSRIALAWSTKSRQTSAGYVPPATGSPPNSVFIGVVASGYPTQTAIVNWCVKPTNHASPKSSVVPVLPAANPP